MAQSCPAAGLQPAVTLDRGRRTRQTEPNSFGLRARSGTAATHIHEDLAMALTQNRNRQTNTRRKPLGECRLDVIQTVAEGRRLTDAAIVAMVASGYSKRDQFAVDLGMEEAI